MAGRYHYSYLDHSYDGLLVPWTVRTMDHSYHGLFVPWTIRTMDCSYHGPFVPWTIRTIDCSYHGPFVPWTIHGLFIPDLLPILTPDYCSEYTIHVHEVTKRLLNINVHKATGPDFIASWILRDFATLIAEPLTAVFNASVREGTVPNIFGSLL